MSISNCKSDYSSGGCCHPENTSHSLDCIYPRIDMTSDARSDTLCDVITVLLDVLSSQHVSPSIKKIAEVKLVDMLSKIKAKNYE